MVVFVCTIFRAKLDATTPVSWEKYAPVQIDCNKRIFSSMRGVDDMYIDIDVDIDLAL
jgi:hypothetical protein